MVWRSQGCQGLVESPQCPQESPAVGLLVKVAPPASPHNPCPLRLLYRLVQLLSNYCCSFHTRTTFARALSDI